MILDPTRELVLTITLDQIPSSSGFMPRATSSQGHVIVGQGDLLGPMLYRLRYQNPEFKGRYRIVDAEGKTTGPKPLHPAEGKPHEHP